MKQKAKHLQSLLLLLILSVVGVANAWGDVTDNFTTMLDTDGDYCYITPVDVTSANNGTRWKIAKGGSIAITAKTGYKIKSISFIWRSDAYQPASTEKWVPTAGTLSSITSWSVDSSVETVTFTNADDKVLHLEGTNCIAVTLESYAASFTVTFNGNSHGTPAAETITQNEPGASITLPNCTADAPADWTKYTFLGWSADPSATSPDAGMTAGSFSPYTPDRDITLYAVYSAGYQLLSSVMPEGKGAITMRVGSESGVEINSGDYVAQGTTVWAEATANSDSGYKATSTSWTGTGATGNPVTFNMGNGGKTLGYTLTPITYHVAFNGNDVSATGSMSPQDFTYDDAQNLSANAFTKAGSDFMGWAKSPEGDVEYADKAEVKNLTTADGTTVTLYAKWSASQTKVTSITLNQSVGTVKVGGNLALSVTEVLPADATNKSVTWNSSDDTKATVDENGLVTGVATGSATITATANDDSGVTATCTVTVEAAPAANVELKNLDFTTWETETVPAGGTSHDVYFKRQITVTEGTGFEFPGDASTTDNYIAIPLENINGAISVTVTLGGDEKNHSLRYQLVTGNSAIPASTAPTSFTEGAPGSKGHTYTFEINSVSGSYGVLYLGRNGSSSKKFQKVEISTPATTLVADPASATVLGVGNTEIVDVTTNSTGNITYSIADASIADVEHTVVPVTLVNKFTIVGKALGTTSLRVNVSADDTHPAKSIDIPVSVENPAITIGTQPAGLSFNQGDTSAKTFSVAATVNTGNELTYQWYKNNASSAEVDDEHKIAGATSATYALTAEEKNTIGTSYYYCVASSETDELSATSSVATLEVTALAPGQTYSPTVYVGHNVVYSGLTGWSVYSNEDTGEAYYTVEDALSAEGKITITGKAAGSGEVVLKKDGESDITINVTVKKRKVTITWSVGKKEFPTPPSVDAAFAGLPTYAATNEDGTPYTGDIMFYTDDQSVAYFRSGNQKVNYSLTYNPNQVYYGGIQGGAKIYAYIQEDEEIEGTKASFDLTVQQGIKNSLPAGESIDPQDQYTLWDGDTKLITVTYGGYKYASNTLSGKNQDVWNAPRAEVSKENAIDGFEFATVNMKNDALNEKGVMVTVDKTKTDVWPETNRLNVFSLPVAGSYITFEAHESGTLTAYVLQNGIIGRKNDDGTLATNPRVAYWVDQEGNLQDPTYVVSKTALPNKYDGDSGNTTGRDTNKYDKNNYEDIDDDGVEELARCLPAWNAVPNYMALVKMLKSKRCKKQNLPTDKSTQTQEISDYGDDAGTYPYVNPYYWGTQAEVEANNKKALPDPIRPVPFNGGYLMLHRGYVKYVLPVVAGKTYYFFGSGTKVGYIGMNFYKQANPGYAEQTTRQHFENTSNLTEYASTQAKSTLYKEVTIPSNFRLNTWNTICLPFNVTENQVREVFGNDTELAIYNGLEQSPNAENNYIIKYLRHVDQNILAGQPYLIYPTGKEVAKHTNQEGGQYYETGNTLPTVEVSGKEVLGSKELKAGDTGTIRILFKNVLIEKSFAAQSYGSNVDVTSSGASLDHSYYLFTPTTQPTTVEKYSWYINVTTGDFTRYTGNGTTLNTFHAYIKPNGAYSDIVKQMSISGAFMDDMADDSEPTAIFEIDGNAVEVAGAKTPANGKAYNMMGQQVDANSAKGLVIVNGKKYIMQ